MLFSKMLCLYLLGQNCLHLTFKPYLSSETYSRKYEKLPNIVIHACKNNTEKMFLMKMSGPQIWLCLFTFRPIASKQLNGLTTIDSLSRLGGAVVTHPLWVLEVRDETIGRYIDTVSIRRLTIRIEAQRDISRYDLDICNQGKSPRCL